MVKEEYEDIVKNEVQQAIAADEDALTSLVSSVVDKAAQEKIDLVKSRLIRNYGYCDVCSTDVLQLRGEHFRSRACQEENGSEGAAVSQKIERDHQRFRKIVRGKVKSNLSK